MLSEYWQDIARELITNRHPNPLDLDATAAWIGRASAVMAEALRVSGDSSGIDSILKTGR